MPHKPYLSPLVQVGAIVILMVGFGLIYSCSQQEETDIMEATAKTQGSLETVALKPGL